MSICDHKTSPKEKALKTQLFHTATLVRGKGEENMSAYERKGRNDKRGVVEVWSQKKIIVVLGSPAAVMALNIF